MDNLLPWLPIKEFFRFAGLATIQADHSLRCKSERLPIDVTKGQPKSAVGKAELGRQLREKWG